VTKVRGRRPGASGTYEAILTAAQRQFAELGYDRTSIRGIGRDAGVDPKLVTYYFGSKQELFMAAVAPTLPPSVNELLPRILSGGRRRLGHRIAGLMVGLLENPETRDRLVGVVRAASSEPEAARMLRDIRARLLVEVEPAVAQVLDGEDVPVRIAMINAHFVGLVMVREVVRAEPLRSMSPRELEALLEPVVQYLLTGPIRRPS
jgi:AcrR family transcriptional regulator